MHFYVGSNSAEKQFKAVFVIISRCLMLLLILHLLTRSSAHKPSETCLLIPESIGRPHRKTGLPLTRGQPPASGVCCARGQAPLEMMEEHVEAAWPVAAPPRFHITAPPKIIRRRPDMRVQSAEMADSVRVTIEKLML